MINNKHTQIFAAVVLMLAGCGPKDAPEQTGGTGSLRIAQTTAWYATKDEGVLFVVWSDAVASAAGNGAAATGYQGSLTSDGRRIEIQSTTHDGKSGKVTLNGRDYDLTAGNVFLVSGKTGQINVRQLKRDLSQLKPAAKSFEEFARNDADLGPFIAPAGKPTP